VVAANQNQASNVPIPDPTVLTTEAIRRDIEHLRELLTIQVEGIRRDLENIEGEYHDVVSQSVQQLRELCGEKFSSFEFRFAGVQQQFDERDARTDQSARSNRELVEAALAAQKEAVGKNETATKEQLTSIKTEIGTEISALREQVDDLKLVNRHEGGESAGRGQVWRYGNQAIATIVGLALVALAVFTALR
jgi:hypothetical protein